MEKRKVVHVDEGETTVSSMAPRQMFGFVEFRNEEADLVIAIRVDTIAFYAPLQPQQREFGSFNRTTPRRR